MDNLIKEAPKAIPVGADNTRVALTLPAGRGRLSLATTPCSPASRAGPVCGGAEQKAFTAEPYGLGFNEDDVDFVRFVNARLDQMRADGEWTRIYNRWLRDALGPGAVTAQKRSTAGRDERDHACRTGDRSGRAGADGLGSRPRRPRSMSDELGRWRDATPRAGRTGQGRAASGHGSAATGDILLSMALWKAVSDRYELLLATWNSGRGGATELMRMSTLIWGRLDASTASGLSVSLPEACRLSDALLSQLRVKLGLDPSGMEITERIRQLRAQMERIREQIDLEPAGAAQQQAHSSSPDWHAG